MKPKSYRRKGPRLSGLSKAKLAVAAQVVQQVLAELPELMAVAVVDVASGASLAAHSTTTIDPATAASFNAEVVRLKQKAMTALQLTGEHLDDILVTLSSQLHLLQLTADGKRFIYLVVATQSSNLGIAREVLRGKISQLEAQ